ncbi:hypothetical protein KJ682_13985 [bacterium]|nr:hypothetical protein [bacterium]
MALLAVLGCVSLLGQVVLLREVTVAFFGSELVILLGIGLWLLGTGLGAAVAGRIRGGALLAVPVLLLVAGLLIPGLVVWARAVRAVWGAVPGAYLSFSGQMVAMSTILLPAALISGLVFALAARAAVSRGRSLGTAYAVECAGALLGGAAATGFVAAGLGNLAQGMVCGLIAAGAGAMAGRTTLRGAGTAACLVLAAGLAFSPALDRSTTRWNHPDLLTVRDTPYGRITAENRQGQLAFFVNDALAYENQGTAAEEFVQLAALQVDDPRRILVLGGGLTGILDEVGKLRAQEVVYVERDPVLLAMMRDVTDTSGFGLSDPALETVIADPRGYLAGQAGWDLVLVGMPEPDSALANRYYTAEFFTACRRALAPRGVLAFRLAGSENVRTPARIRRAAAIGQALEEAFASVVVVPGSVDVFLASASSLPRDAATLADRLTARGTETRLVSPAYLEYLYGNDRFAEMDSLLASADVSANTDGRPDCFRHTLLLWLSRFRPAVGWVEAGSPTAANLFGSPWAWAIAAAWAVTVRFARRHPRLRRVVAMGAIGAAGMALEAAVLMDFQVRVGALYQDLGLLLCLFMLGMALGSAAGARWTGAFAGRIWGPAGGLAAVALAAWWSMERGLLGSLPAAGATLMFGASAVGWAFALLGETAGSSPDRTASPLIAADLAGSALGSLAAGLVLIPLWGPGGAAVGAALLSVAILAL